MALTAQQIVQDWWQLSGAGATGMPISACRQCLLLPIRRSGGEAVVLRYPL